MIGDVGGRVKRLVVLRRAAWLQVLLSLTCYHKRQDALFGCNSWRSPVWAAPGSDLLEAQAYQGMASACLFGRRQCSGGGFNANRK